MAKINLLDWRQELRERRRKQFFAMLVLSALGGLVLVLGAISYMNSAIEYQNQRNTYLKNQIAELDKQIVEIQELEKVKANLLARMRVIEKLQASRSAMVHFFDEIVNTLPEGVFLTSLKQTGDLVAIEGVAESNGRISSYMKNLENSAWFAEPQLIVIRTTESKDKSRQSQFSLKVKNLTTAKLVAAQAAEDAAAEGGSVEGTATEGSASTKGAN